MGRKQSTPCSTQPTLPEDAPRIQLSAPAEAPKSRCDTAQPVTLIGSRRDCDLFIGEGDVAKLHCVLVNTGSAIIVTDLCSRSGTFVNGQAITAPTPLHPDDELRVGGVAVDVSFAAIADDYAATPDQNAADRVDSVLRIDGPEDQFELSVLPAVIGRRQACQVVVDTPDVSLTHALLFTIGGCPAVCDLGSRSGTILNSERVTLAWLGDGDRLNIGGEEYSLSWDGPQFVEPAPAAEAVDTEDVSAQASASPATAVQLNSLDDIGSMIEGLKAQINASQGRLQQRTEELNLREAELDQRSRELDEQRASFANEQQRVEQQRSEFRLALSGLEEERRQLEAQRVEIDQRESKIAEQLARSEQQRADCEKMAEDLTTRDSDLQEREERIESREKELAARLAELAKREAETAAAAATIQQFKNALSEAKRVFETVDEPHQDPTPAPAPKPPTRPARPPAKATRKRSSRKTTRTSQAQPSDEALPAPLVAEPMFQGLDRNSPSQWPKDMRDRLRSLRRVSGKSDAELIPRVLAEFQAEQDREPKNESGKKKKKRKRGWLS